MKIIFAVLLLTFISCKKEELKISNKKNVHRFLIGDINNDRINDTAFVYSENIKNEEFKDISIKFSSDIPKLDILQSLNVIIEPTEDLNNDNANEIIVFSRTNNGWWNIVSIWTFQNKTWNKIAQTEAFTPENKDFKNRVINESGVFFLIGEDKWNEEENGDFKKVKIKL